jgi:hypothetical protein
MDRSKEQLYSITSSAMASSDGGTWRRAKMRTAVRLLGRAPMIP